MYGLADMKFSLGCESFMAGVIVERGYMYYMRCAESKPAWYQIIDGNRDDYEQKCRMLLILFIK